MSAAGLFVTGSDTGVGKTTVSVGLARLARRRGRAPIPYKPVETGCDPRPHDAELLWTAAHPPTTLAETCPFPLPLPVAPAAAAVDAGLTLDLADLARRAARLRERGDFLLVEGAGGLLAPYGRAPGAALAWTNADLAERLGLPVLVVGRTALGTINHVSLTLSELARRRLPLAGLVLVRTSEAAGPQEPTNAALIEEVTGIRPLGPLPFLPPAVLADADRVADALEGALESRVLANLLGEPSG